MTSLKDLEDRIKNAEAALDAMKTDLEHLKKQEHEPETLFGRWATHPNLGRGIIISDHEDIESEVRFACFDEVNSTGAVMAYAPTIDLTIDPAVLTTVEDYEQAPVGTIIEVRTVFVAYKISKSTWSRTDTELPWLNNELAELGATRVIRWGDGK